MIIGISGKAGVGKDTSADILVRELSFVKISLADPLKRICRDVFDFSADQLWGPSEKRNEPDLRYKRHEPETMRERFARECDREVLGPDWTPDPGPAYLTPRHALQQLGTEWGRACYPNVWVDYVTRIYKRLQAGGCYYSQYLGLQTLSFVQSEMMVPRTQVVIPDVRFKNEVEGLKAAGAKLLRIKRPEAGLTGSYAGHASEAEQDSIPDEMFDRVIDNDGSLLDLKAKVLETMLMLRGQDAR